MMGREQNRTRGIILTFAGGVSFGFSGTCVQYLLNTKGINPVCLTTMRMLFAGIILMVIAFIKQRETVCEIIKDKKDLAMLLLFGTVGIMSCQYTYIAAISYSNAGTATVLEYLGPVLIMIFVCLKSARLPSINEIIAIILALSGTFLLATHGDIHSLAISKGALFWGLLSAFAFAFYSTLPENLIKKRGSLPVTAFGMFIGGIILTTFTRAWEFNIDLDIATVLSLLVIVLIGTVSAFLLYLQGISDIGPSNASLIACIEPVSATIFSSIWMKSSFGKMDLVGFAAIITCVLLLSFKKNNEYDENDIANICDK